MPTLEAPAADRAYAYTKQLILSGELAGGQMISEGVVCAALGISRTPVHEAFLRLDAEKLLVLASRKGAAVVPMAPDEARDVLEMREAIEVSTARRVFGRGVPAPDALAAMRESLRPQRALAAQGDVEAFIEADERFHAVLVHASRNVTAAHFYELLRDRSQRLRWQLLHVVGENLQAAVEDHELLLAAAEAGDGEEFCRLLGAHIRRHQGIL